MKRLIKSLAVITLLIAITSVTFAQSPQCLDHKHVVENLEAYYDERVVLSLFDRARGLVEVFVSGRGNWTIVHTQRGCTRVITSGFTWQYTNPSPTVNKPSGGT